MNLSPAVSIFSINSARQAATLPILEVLALCRCVVFSFVAV